MSLVLLDLEVLAPRRLEFLDGSDAFEIIPNDRKALGGQVEHLENAPGHLVALRGARHGDKLVVGYTVLLSLDLGERATKAGPIFELRSRKLFVEDEAVETAKRDQLLRFGHAALAVKQIEQQEAKPRFRVVNPQSARIAKACLNFVDEVADLTVMLIFAGANILVDRIQQGIIAENAALHEKPRLLGFEFERWPPRACYSDRHHIMKPVVHVSLEALHALYTRLTAVNHHSQWSFIVPSEQ